MKRRVKVALPILLLTVMAAAWVGYRSLMRPSYRGLQQPG